MPHLKKFDLRKAIDLVIRTIVKLEPSLCEIVKTFRSTSEGGSERGDMNMNIDIPMRSDEYWVVVSSALSYGPLSIPIHSFYAIVSMYVRRYLGMLLRNGSYLYLASFQISLCIFFVPPPLLFFFLVFMYRLERTY